MLLCAIHSQWHWRYDLVFLVTCDDPRKPIDIRLTDSPMKRYLETCFKVYQSIELGGCETQPDIPVLDEGGKDVLCWH